MEFLKKNYEKVILSVVLLGLVGVLIAMWFVIQADQQKMSTFKDMIFNTPNKPLPELDLASDTQALQRLKSPFKLDLESTNHLFNPVEWQRMNDGRLVRRETLGAKAATVTDITPLYLVISLDGVETNELGARYNVGIERQAAPLPALRRKTGRFVSTDDRKKDLFTLLDVQGPADNPTALVLKLADTGETISISRDKQ
ncbi:MAG TPA: hypothetical protein VFV81_04165, partial [Verrucomicrobiae bacterium]|nr:hypothetical protein [Verrucomicrobiae bacterium]